MDEIKYAQKVVREIPQTIAGLKSMKRLAEIELEHLTPRHDINEFLDMFSIFETRIEEYTIKRETLIRFLRANGYEHFCFDPLPILESNTAPTEPCQPPRKTPWYKRILTLLIRCKLLT